MNALFCSAGVSAFSLARARASAFGAVLASSFLLLFRCLVIDAARGDEPEGRAAGRFFCWAFGDRELLALLELAVVFLLLFVLT